MSAHSALTRSPIPAGPPIADFGVPDRGPGSGVAAVRSRHSDSGSTTVAITCSHQERPCQVGGRAQLTNTELEARLNGKTLLAVAANRRRSASSGFTASCDG